MIVISNEFNIDDKIEFKIGTIIEVKAKPNSSKSEIVFEQDKILVFLKSIPDDNKANGELVKLFKKQLKLKVEIISGFKSRNKKLKFI